MQQPVPYSSLFKADPAPLEVRACLSLPAAISNMMLLVDYVATDSTVPTAWPWGVWERFTPDQREMRARLSPLLVHGLVLQDHWFQTLSPPSPAHGDWQELRRSIAALSDVEIRTLLARGWVSGLEFYLTEMVRTDALDAYLPENARDLTVEELVAAPDLLDSLHAFTYAAWGVRQENLQEYVAFASDPAQVRSGMIQLLDAVWMHGGSELWESGRAGLEHWTGHAATRIAVGSWEDGVTAARDLTGRTPPQRLQPDVRAARTITLLPCLELGSNQSIATVGSDVFLMFQPPATPLLPGVTATDGMKLADAVNLMRTLSDPAAFSLVQVLANRQELYALELVEESGIHQSTVSRQLAALERTGAVAVRREGKAKYYRLRPERVDLAMQVIRQSLRGEA